MSNPSKPSKAFYAEVLTIGNELLRGSVLNSNARFLGRVLTDEGFESRRQISCEDSVGEIAARLDEAISRSHLVILTGGLGPTPDDVTREAVAVYCRVPLIFSKPQLNHILRYYGQDSRKVPAIVRQEAMFPQNSRPLINRHGIALGFYCVRPGGLVVVLPGVPAEMEKMYYELVQPLIRKYFKGLKKKSVLVVKTVGISEPSIMQRLRKDFFKDSFDFGIYPEPGEVSLRIYARSAAVTARLKKKIQKRLRLWVYAFEDVSLAEVIGRILTRRRKTLSVAESCTAGLVSAEITRASGASRYFKGAVVSYGNSVKADLLEVSPGIIKIQGAVSKETALSMVRGVREKMRSDYALSVTGIAGPAGGSRKKPVGTVYVGLASPRQKRVEKYFFRGDRSQIRTKAVKKSLCLLWQEIRETSKAR